MQPRRRSPRRGAGRDVDPPSEYPRRGRGAAATPPPTAPRPRTRPLRRYREKTQINKAKDGKRVSLMDRQSSNNAQGEDAFKQSERIIKSTEAASKYFCLRRFDSSGVGPRALVLTLS